MKIAWLFLAVIVAFIVFSYSGAHGEPEPGPNKTRLVSYDSKKWKKLEVPASVPHVITLIKTTTDPEPQLKTETLLYADADADADTDLVSYPKDFPDPVKQPCRGRNCRNRSSSIRRRKRRITRGRRRRRGLSLSRRPRRRRHKRRRRHRLRRKRKQRQKKRRRRRSRKLNRRHTLVRIEIF